GPVKKDRQLRADDRHLEHCCHEPVDAVLGPLDDLRKSGIYRLTSGPSGRSAGVACGKPRLRMILTASRRVSRMSTSLLHSCQPALHNPSTPWAWWSGRIP